MARKRSPRPAAPQRGLKASRPGADNPAGASAGGFELRELRQLIRLVQRTGIGELELSSGGRSVRISAVSTASGFAPDAVQAIRGADPAGSAPPAAAAPAGSAGAPPASP